MGQSPFQRHCLSYPYVLVRTSRRPLVFPDNERLRNIDHLRTRRHARLHRQCIEERFYRGTYLTLALTDIVILEIAVVRSAHVGFDMSGGRLHRHKACTENRLVVADGVVRGHSRVDISFLFP